MKTKLVNIERHSSKTASINVIEVLKTLNFEAKRIFYIHNEFKNEIRGRHAHRKCIQFLIPLLGEFEIYCNDGSNEKSYILNDPSKGLLIPPMIWSKQTYKNEKNILLVIASEEYEENDYIYNINALA